MVRPDGEAVLYNGVAAVNTLSVWRFDTPDAAESALRSLKRLQMRGAIEIDDIAVVVWPSDSLRPWAYQAGSAAGTGELTGAFWGLLFALLFLLPLTGPTSGPTSLVRVGLPEEFLSRIRSRIVPGTSALFLLGSADLPDRVGAALRCPASEVLVSTLDADQQTALRHAFAVGQFD